MASQTTDASYPGMTKTTDAAGQIKKKMDQIHNDEWSEVITPRNKLFELRLKEVWRYRDLMTLFVKRDLVSQYRQTVLGPIWHIIQPVLTTIMFLVLFNKIAKIPTDNIPPVIFYMSGVAIWNYFSACLTGT